MNAIVVNAFQHELWIDFFRWDFDSICSLVIPIVLAKEQLTTITLLEAIEMCPYNREQLYMLHERLRDLDEDRGHEVFFTLGAICQKYALISEPYTDYYRLDMDS